MDNKDLKITELRACFDRENTRKESLQNKTSYFLGVISIAITIICTDSSVFAPFDKFYSYVGIMILFKLALSFLLSVGLCVDIIFPKNYSHPFDFKSSEYFIEGFEIDDETFAKSLFDQYALSTCVNHNLNDELVFKLNAAVFSFFVFLLFFIMMKVLL